MKRTLIELSKDGNILITRQASKELSGSSHERRLERRLRLLGEAPPEWKRINRTIVHDVDSVHFPVRFSNACAASGVEGIVWSGNDLLAAENEQIARRKVREAAHVVAHNARAAEQFHITPAKKYRVVFEETA